MALEEDETAPSLSQEVAALRAPRAAAHCGVPDVLQGWSQQLTAEHLGISATTVQRAGKAALATLRKQLQA